MSSVEPNVGLGTESSTAAQEIGADFEYAFNLDEDLSLKKFFGENAWSFEPHESMSWLAQDDGQEVSNSNSTSGLSAPLAPGIEDSMAGEDWTLTQNGSSELCARCTKIRCQCSLSGASEMPTTGCPTSRSWDDSDLRNERPDTLENPILAKVGTRFSKESTRILRQWLLGHSDHPYPDSEELQLLEYQTGLSKTQIKNWLANSRRRNKLLAKSRPMSPFVFQPGAGVNPIDIPRRPGTPAITNTARQQDMNPLERWVDSPPEGEPATVTAIAHAIASASPILTNFSSTVNSDDSRSLYNESSAGSLCTSSGGSYASAFSHSLDTAPNKLNAPSRVNFRRRRRLQNLKNTGPRHSFECTFCTETFKTKYDWQRHEKSLHMPLDRWACSPFGPQVYYSEIGKLCCVFCGESNSTAEHIESHNPTSCQERIFNRKDHLKQHLRLVHKSDLVEWATKSWKLSSPEVRSRCGFCNISLGSWDERAEHLAKHYKMGKTMADWAGDWGFETPVAHTIENSIPPYLIHGERASPFPLKASVIAPESPRNAFELIGLELTYFAENHFDEVGRMPHTEAMHLEACRIIFAAEVLEPSGRLELQHRSWLRDLFTSNKAISQKAQFSPIRSRSESRLVNLQIRGKSSIFEACPLESQLQNYARNMPDNGLGTIKEEELQEEASRIVAQISKDLILPPSEFVLKWILRLIRSSTEWLQEFRRSAIILPNQHANNALIFLDSTSGQTNFDSLFNLGIDGDVFASNEPDYSPGLAALNRNVHEQAKSNITEGGDLDVKNEILGFASEDPIQSLLLSNFREECSQSGAENLMNEHRTTTTISSNITSTQQESIFQMESGETESYVRPSWLSPGTFLLNDFNFHRWLGRELGRWAKAVMSPNNPNCHVPSDEEIQHHARCLMYEDDDAWNQTCANNPEWLRRFKVDVGILPDEEITINGA